MTLPILFTVAVVALLLALNFIGLRRHWQAWRETRREPDFELIFPGALIRCYWMGEGKGPSVYWRADVRRAVQLLDEIGPEHIPEWQPGDVIRMLQGCAPPLRLVIVAGDYYTDPRVGNVRGQYAWGAITIAYRDGDVASTTLVHELIRAVDEKVHGIRDPHCENWEERGAVDRLVMRQI